MQWIKTKDGRLRMDLEQISYIRVVPEAERRDRTKANPWVEVEFNNGKSITFMNQEAAALLAYIDQHCEQEEL